MNTPTYGTTRIPRIGCYLEHSNRNSNELSADIVQLAIEFGYQPDEIDRALMACYHHGWLSDDGFSALDEASEDAITWLNDQEHRSYLHWANNGEAGAFGLWPSVESAQEDCEFVSSRFTFAVTMPTIRKCGVWSNP